MTWLIKRGSALLVLAVAAITIIWIIPAQVPTGMDGSVQPGTMPMIMAWLLGLGAFFALFEGTSKDAPDIVLLKRSALFLAVLGLSLVLTLHVGFKWAAPVLSLSVMLLSYERRLAWMAVGAGLIPLMIWLLFDVFLGRPLV